jgi:hypothetical protein
MRIGWFLRNICGSVGQNAISSAYQTVIRVHVPSAYNVCGFKNVACLFLDKDTVISLVHHKALLIIPWLGG